MNSLKPFLILLALFFTLPWLVVIVYPILLAVTREVDDQDRFFIRSVGALLSMDR